MVVEISNRTQIIIRKLVLLWNLLKFLNMDFRLNKSVVQSVSEFCV